MNEATGGLPVGRVVEGWSVRAPARAVPLGGRYVTLQPLTLDHAPALFTALGDAASRDLWTYRPTEAPRDEAAMADVVGDLLGAPGMESWTIRPAGGAPEGLISYLAIAPAHGSVEIASVLFSRRLRRTRAATETVHLLMRHAFDGLGYRRVEWKCDHLNAPSRAAALRLGFAYEGRFRQHMVTKGRSRDTDWFSVIDTDWPAVRVAHEAWLEPANFDADGVQLAPLRRDGP